MKVFIYGFWGGFLDKTDPVNIEFFKHLLELVFRCKIEIGGFHDSEILLESIFSHNTALSARPWKYSFLYSGESRLNNWHKQYNCVLYSENNHDNIINLPLFIPYIYCSKDINKLTDTPNITRVPPKNICAIISNSGGTQRNHILNRIAQRIPIDYAGRYNQNVDIITEPYHTEAFSRKIGEYKFIATMENSVVETYITEKITHGFYADTIPIYFGSPRITEYFNADRFINITSTDNAHIDSVIDKIIELINDNDKYIEMINKPILPNNSMFRTIPDVVSDIQRLLHS